MRRHRRSSQAMQGLNLTSLLDITFVLLIAFMVVAPALTHTMEVDLPEAEAPPQPPPDKDQNVIHVSVQYGDAPEGPHPLLVDTANLRDLEELEMLARTWDANAENVALEIDWRVPYGTYIQVAATLQRAGVMKYQLVYREPKGS